MSQGRAAFREVLKLALRMLDEWLDDWAREDMRDPFVALAISTTHRFNAAQ